MQLPLGRSAWLGVALLAALSLTVATVFAHDGRVVGQYRIVVGFSEEPAYEGMKNGVAIRVTKISDDGQQSGGHHGQGSGDAASQQEGSTEGHHGQGSGMSHGMVEVQGHMSVDVTAEADPMNGVNVGIIPEGLAFTPENVNLENIPGEGHAHIYVDGEKVSRVYTPQFYLKDIGPGTHTVRITLNANSHGDYASHGQVIEASTEVTVPDSSGESHVDSQHVAAEAPMSLSIALAPDAAEGANLSIDSQGFTFAAHNVNRQHIPGEGYAYVYVNGTPLGRLYGPALHLGNLEQGMNEVRVILKTNTHDDYTWNHQVVEAVATVHMERGGGDQASHHGSSGASPQGTSHESSMNTMDSDKPGSMTSMAAMPAGEQPTETPVEGLEGSLQVEVTHTATEASRVLTLSVVPDKPGHYTADLIPTAAGVYQFRVFGSVEGNQIDESFISKGGGGDFDDVVSSSALQFPEKLPELRELESAVRGAISTAESAHDTAMASASGSADSGNTMSIAAIVAGVVGMLTGAGGLLLAMRRR